MRSECWKAPAWEALLGGSISGIAEWLEYGMLRVCSGIRGRTRPGHAQDPPRQDTPRTLHAKDTPRTLPGHAQAPRTLHAQDTPRTRLGFATPRIDG